MCLCSIWHLQAVTFGGKSNTQYQWPTGASTVRLNTESYGLRTLVVVKTANKTELKLLFDTSSTITGLYPHGLQKLSDDTSFDKETGLLSGQLGKMSFSDLELSAISCQFCPDYDGVIGTELLQHFAVLWSSKKAQVVLYKPKDPLVVASGRVQRMYIVDGMPVISAKLHQNDERKLRVKLIVNSGSLLPMEVMPATVNLRRIEIDGYKTSIYSQDNSLQAIGTIPVVEWEYSNIQNVPVQLALVDTYAEPVSGQLGAPVLSAFDLLFDYYGQRVITKNNPNLDFKIAVNLSGIDLQKLQNGEFVVTKRDLDADSILKVGDIITQINRFDAQALSQHDLYQILLHKYRVKLCRKSDQACESIEILPQLPKQTLTGVEAEF